MKLMFNKITINIPSKINVIIWKKKCEIIYIKLFNDSKKFNFYINSNKSYLLFDKWSNSILLEKRDLSCNFIKFENKLFDFLKSWDEYFFSKLKFKGKGFRIRYLKKLKLLKFFFGRSHKTFILFKSIYLKKINKYKFILRNINKEVVLFNSKIVTKIKPLNFYTLRGLRMSKQIVFKRKGKKGTYI